MADTWIYHKDHPAQVVDSIEAERLKGEGWVDHPAKAKNAKEILKQEELDREKAENKADLDAEAAAKEREALKDELRKEISSLREVDREIMTQHEKIFDWMASSNQQQKGNYPSYD